MTITFNQLGNMGHLGNQMFQYASLRGIAANNNLDWCIPPQYVFGNSYPLRSNIYECFDLSTMDIINVSIISNSILYERYYHFDEELFNSCPDNVDLNGYYQSYKYFSFIKNIILKDFTFKKEIREQGEKIMKPFDNKKTVSLHVRRTDYLNNIDYHPTPDFNYYEKALNAINPEIILVFSDDIIWCKEQKIFKDALIVNTNNPYLDLYMMSNCKNSIIANSSFSWWGAWLNQNDNKIVFAPSQWFGPALNHDTKDLIPEDWFIV